MQVHPSCPYKHAASQPLLLSVPLLPARAACAACVPPQPASPHVDSLAAVRQMQPTTQDCNVVPPLLPRVADLQDYVRRGDDVHGGWVEITLSSGNPMRPHVVGVWGGGTPGGDHSGEAGSVRGWPGCRLGGCGCDELTML